MNLQEWRERQQRTYTTPDGVQVVCRRVALVDLAASGHIPAPLLGTVQQLEQRSRARQGFDIGQLPEFGKLLTVICLASIVHAVLPDGEQVAVREQASDDALGLDEIPFQTRVEIFMGANEEALALASFRTPERPDADSAPPGDGLPHETLAAATD